MKPKKTEKSDVDARSGLYFRIGVVFALLAVIVAFEWTFYDKVETKLQSDLNLDEEEEIADITQQKKEKPPPPPPPPEIEVVEDDVELEDEIEIEEVDIDDDFEMEIQEEEEEEAGDEVFVVVEDPPSFPGGDGEMMQYIQKNIKYPKKERELGIQGRVVVSFVVNPDGNLSNFEVLVSPSDNLAEEALRVVKSMPKWQPGKQRGKAVKVRVNLPVMFKLSG